MNEQKPSKYILTVSEAEVGTRLDKFLSSTVVKLSRTRIKT